MIPFHRRHFIKGAGGGMLALPFLPSLWPQAARAQVGAKPKRFIALWLNHSIHHEEWWRTVPMEATGAHSLFQKSVFRRHPSGAFEYDLLKHTGELGAIFSSRWDAIRKHLTILHGIEDYGASVAEASSHNCGHFLSGCWPVGPDELKFYAKSEGESIDNLVIDRVYHATPAHKRIYLRFPYEDWEHGQLVWTRAGEKLQPVSDTVGADVAFNVIFQDIISSDASSPEIRRRLESNKTIVDGVLAEIAEKLGSPQIGSSDREKLQRYVQLVQEQQQRLAALGKTMGQAAQTPPRPRKFEGPWTEQLLKEFLSAQVANIVGAIKTNATQVAILRCHGGSEFAQVFGSTMGDIHHDYHSKALKHTTPARRLVFDGLADLIEQLDEVEDPITGETYLDNTVILFGTDHGNEDHRGYSLPIFLASGKNGALNTGKAFNFFRYDLAARPGTSNRCFPGRPYTQVLASIAAAFGLEMDEVKKRTNMRYNGKDGLYATEWDKPLPGLIRS